MVMNSRFIKTLRKERQQGQLPLIVLLFSTIAMIILSGFILWADANLKTVYRNTDQATAFSIAEAGIEYYRWHLAHASQDYQDGTGGPGPYPHDYFDKNGVKIGQFILAITSPPAGSTVVGIKSTGKVENNSGVEKVIESKVAIPSLAKYAAAINTNVRFGERTEIFGPIHSNGGIHFDGIAHGLVTSALAEYNDPDHAGNNEFGVHTHVLPVDPMPPSPVPNRPDIFLAGRQFPVPAIDFVGITSDLADIKAKAQTGGSYYGPSGAKGYHLVLKTNDTYDLYKVTKVLGAPYGCIEVLGQKFWGIWVVEAETLLGNYAFPSNNSLFFEDDLWVDGQINTARLTIASGRFPENSSKYTSIIVNKDLLYTNYSGQDVIGLISQGNLGVGWNSEDDLRIDGALIAQNGRVGRYYYRPPSGNQNRCAPYHIRQVITLYGMIASNERYGFAYTDGTGYQTRNIIYDPNLFYAPPPNFPLLSSDYQQIFWSEIK